MSEAGILLLSCAVTGGSTVGGMFVWERKANIIKSTIKRVIRYIDTETQP